MTDTLIAGRELDALIAEKVMGWRRVLGCFKADSDAWHEDGVLLVPYPPTYKYVKEPPWTTRPITREGTYPRYSTDMAAAWQVVEKMEGGFRLGYAPPDWPFDVTLWASASSGGATAQADTLPLAICIAALRAVGQ